MQKNKWRCYQYSPWMRRIMQSLTFSEMVKAMPVQQIDTQKYLICPDCQKPIVECRCCGGE